MRVKKDQSYRRNLSANSENRNKEIKERIKQ